MDIAYGKSYAFSINQLLKFPNCPLAAAYRFMSTSENNKIYKYKCIEYTYEEFDIIYRIICGQYILATEVIKHEKMIDFFCFEYTDLLIDIFTVDKPIKPNKMPKLEGLSEDLNISLNDILGLGLGQKCCSNCFKPEYITKLYTCTKCNKVQYCSTDCQIISWNKNHKLACKNKIVVKDNKDFIICPSKEKIDIICETVLKLKQPYIRFCLILAEGSSKIIAHSGDYYGGDTTFKMDPVYFTIGDYNNLYIKSTLLKKSCSNTPSSLESYIIDKGYKKLADKYKNKTVIIQNEESGSFEKDTSSTKYINLEEDAYCEYSMIFDLKISENKKETFSNIIKNMMDQDDELIPIKGKILPSAGKAIYENEFFHIDAKGKACFNLKQAEKMCEYIENSNFIARIKEQINNIDFVLPQEFKEEKGDFYNENVYSTFNFIQINGLINPLIFYQNK